MKKEVFETLKKGLIKLGVLFIVFLVIFKILFFRENLIVVFRTVLSIFWMFVLPGYSIMLYWNEKLDFVERLVIGIALSAAIIGISSYYIGLIGLNIKYHVIILPLTLIILGIIIISKK